MAWESIIKQGLLGRVPRASAAQRSRVVHALSRRVFKWQKPGAFWDFPGIPYIGPSGVHLVDLHQGGAGAGAVPRQRSCFDGLC